VIALESNKPIHPQPSLDLKILVDELLTRSDSMTRDMFYRRVQGFSWQEIGISHGISGHAAEKHFNQSIHKIRQKLGPKER
jgi:DNA-directed RNA polymerase specialized sigma24 family protein